MNKARILLAEDNTINQDVALGQLESLGCTADVVSNGREALEAVSHGAYDIVLMDCMMPEMDGYAATIKIREEELKSGRHLHIIAMTANAMQGDREKCIAAGMDDYVSKPVQLAELRRALGKWVSIANRQGGGSHPVTTAPTRVELGPVSASDSSTVTVSSEPPVDVERLVEVTQNKPEKTRRLLTTFLTQADEASQKLLVAIQSGDVTEVKLIAHKIVGAGSSLGIIAVVPMLSQLEQMGDAGQLEGAEEVRKEFAGQMERVRQFVDEYLKIHAPAATAAVS